MLNRRAWGRQLPTCLLREKNYGVPLEQFPPPLKGEVVELLRWKQAEYAFDRPKDARHWPVTSKRLQHVICALLGFVVNVRGGTEITLLSQLAQNKVIGGFAEWCINERKVKGQTLQRNLRLLFAAMHQHPVVRVPGSRMVQASARWSSHRAQVGIEEAKSRKVHPV